MTGLEIAALIAMLGGAYVQHQAQSDAASNARKQALMNAQRQDEWSRQAEKKALDRAQEYTTDTRQQEQAGIEQDLTQQYLAPVESAQAINAAATTTQGEVSNDYKTAKAQSDLKVANNARQLAGLMAKVNSANRLRNNEAIRMTDTGMDIDRLANFANREGAIGDYAAKMAGIPDAGMMIGGQVAMGLGGMGLSSGLGAAGSTGQAGGTGVSATASSSANAGAPIVGTGSGGLGFKAVGTTGLRLPASYYR